MAWRTISATEALLADARSRWQPSVCGGSLNRRLASNAHDDEPDSGDDRKCAEDGRNRQGIRLLVRQLDGTYVRNLFLVGKTYAAPGKANNSEDNEENSDKGRRFHTPAFFGETGLRWAEGIAPLAGRVSANSHFARMAQSGFTGPSAVSERQNACATRRGLPALPWNAPRRRLLHARRLAAQTDLECENLFETALLNTFKRGVLLNVPSVEGYLSDAQAKNTSDLVGGQIGSVEAAVHLPEGAD